MTYGDRLRKRWVVVRLLQGVRWVDVAWFYQYSDAIGYLQILKRIDPATRYEVVFEAGKPACQADPQDPCCCNLPSTTTPSPEA